MDSASCTTHRAMRRGRYLVEPSSAHADSMQVTKLARRIGNVMDTIYGETWDVRLGDLTLIEVGGEMT